MKAYKIAVGVPEGTKPLKRPRRRREKNIKTHFKEIEGENMD
jgi:hypothetical protein